MHIETLKTFCDLVETGSFEKAARRSFISQSAVSQQLKMLETRYRRRLLERGSRRGLELTDAGRLFYSECRALLDRFGQLEDQLKATKDTIAGTVRLATVYSIGLHELPPYVTRFMKAHPNVTVHVEYSRTDRIRDACLHDTIDFGIVAFPVRSSNLSVVPWQQETLVLVCGPEHRLARRRKVRLAEIAREPFIAFEPDIPTRRVIDGILRTHRVDVNVVMEFDNIETIKRAVEVGNGISVLPQTTVINELAGGLLAAADFVEGPFSRNVGVIVRRGRVLSPAARAFLQLLGVPYP